MENELLTYLQSFLTPRRVALFEKVLRQRTQHLTVAVEDVYQLHNTSAVIRSWESFGIQELHVIEEVNTKRIDREIAMGAQKWVDVARHNSAQDCINHLREQGYRIVATTPHKQAHQLAHFDISAKAAIFFGRETQGLSDLVLEQADDYIYIPTVGFTESLNISVSAAITLQHLSSKLKASEVNWQLSDTVYLKKQMEWTKKMIKDVDTIIERWNTTRKATKQ
ncbi:MAG: rRNA methyltransferase [Cytophagaceae bacterium]|nr:rRNA methyltransferase [Cytophagaceae bacterium]